VSAKYVPNADDKAAFAMIAVGLSQRGIACELACTPQSVQNRLYRVKAQRWATNDGRLLTEEERDELIAFERRRFPAKVNR
jgi:hypothetical protein